MKINVNNKFNKIRVFQQTIYLFLKAYSVNYFMRGKLVCFWVLSSVLGACFVRQILIGIFLILFADNSIFFVNCEPCSLSSEVDLFSSNQLIVKHTSLEPELREKVKILEGKLEDCKKSNNELEAKSEKATHYGHLILVVLLIMVGVEMKYPHFRWRFE